MRSEDHTLRGGQSADAPSSVSGPAAAPLTLGRYTVLERVGEGGMGVVFSAFDAELDRRVAIKVLRGGATSDNARLRREAEAMAMVSHPNVVPIYDVGEHRGRLFLAMEFVEPPTLAQWLSEGERSWAQLRQVFVEAGRGLQAAHEAALVHGDFKPQNVLLGNPARPRVTDFGLARPDPTTNVGGSGAPTSTWGSKTKARGTPAYMAPELLRGAPPSPASDQFAFAVTLFEAACGRHPFCDDDEPLERRIALMHAGEVRAPPGDRGVPRWALAALRRSLAREPSARFPSMAELLEVLGRGPGARRRRLWMALAGVGVAGVVAVVAGLDTLRAQRERTECLSDAQDALAEIWNEDVRAALEERFAATGVGLGETLALTTSRVDEYVRDWIVIRREVCGDEAGADPPPIAAARRNCLDRGRAELRSTLSSLTSADADRSVHWKGPALVHGLPSPNRCDRARAESAVNRGPPASAIDALAEISATNAAGRPTQAVALADALVARAEETGDRRVRVHALAERGGLFSQLRRTEEAVRDLKEAYFEALHEGEALVAFEVSCDLVFIHGVVLLDPDKGREWARHAEALREVSADASPGTRAALHSALGMLEFSAERFDEARAHYVRALELREAADGPGANGLAQIHNNLGVLHGQRNDLEQAQQHFQKALGIRRAILGPAHPDLATTMLNVGTALAHRHATMPDALATIEEAIQILEQHEGSSPYALAMAYGIRTGTLVALKRGPDAEASARRTLKLQAAAGVPPLGPARSRRELGQALALQGRADEAEAMLRQAKSELTEVRGDAGEHEGRLALGIFLVAQARFEEARAELQPLLDEVDDQPSQDTQGLVLVEYATAVAALEGADEALTMLRRGTDLLELGAQRPDRVAEARALIERLQAKTPDGP